MEEQVVGIEIVESSDVESVSVNAAECFEDFVTEGTRGKLEANRSEIKLNRRDKTKSTPGHRFAQSTIYSRRTDAILAEAARIANNPDRNVIPVSNDRISNVGGPYSREEAPEHVAR